MSRARDFADLASANASGSLVSPNLVDNGMMAIYQRGTAVITGNTGKYSLDRWNTYQYGGGHLTITKDTEVPTGKGFLSSMKLDVTQAESSMASGDRYLIRQGIEGQNLQRLCKGTSDAKPLTLQFWVRSPKTGIHVALLLDETNSRWCSKSYTIASADTWQYVTVTFPADTTGALPNDHTGALSLRFYLGSGSDTAGGSSLGTTWNTTANQQAVGQVNVLDNTSNNFYLTGVQLELGEVATPFRHENFSDTLKKCERYTQVIGNEESDSTPTTAFGFGYLDDASNAEMVHPLATRMRIKPTVTLSTDQNLDLKTDGQGGAVASTPASNFDNSETHLKFTLDGNAGNWSRGDNGGAVFARWNGAQGTDATTWWIVNSEIF